MNVTTERLINLIAAEATLRPRNPQRPMWSALVVAAIVVIALFSAMLGPRPDFVTALANPHFDFKLVTAATLAVGGLLMLRTCIYPEAQMSWHALHPGLLLLLMGVVAEMFTVPPVDWAARAAGGNALLCLAAIPLLGALPLLGFIAALRCGAPTKPCAAGMSAGLLAGAIAATVYAAHCTDDSPLFMAIWYSLAIGMVAAVGAVAGRLLIRW